MKKLKGTDDFDCKTRTFSWYIITGPFTPAGPSLAKVVRQYFPDEMGPFMIEKKDSTSGYICLLS